jgi:hypothetical protein
MAKQKPARKPPNRSPSWKVTARIAPELEALVEAYRERQRPYSPTIAQIVEHGLRLVLEEERKRKEGSQ